MGHRVAVCKCLLLAFIWCSTEAAILTYRLKNGALVTLVAFHSGTELEGNYSILVESRIILVPFSWVEQNMPICAEVLSRKVAQILICTALGMKHVEGPHNYTDPYRCYSLKYQQVITSSSGAKISCITSTTDDFSILAGPGLVKIVFRPSHELNSTGLSFNMQVNKIVENDSIITSSICVDASLNISREEREQVITLFKGSLDPHGDQCNKTIRLTIISQTHVQYEQVKTETEFHVATSQRGITTITASTSTPEHERRSCDSHLVQDVTLALILILLISIVIVLCSVLIYTNCCCRKARRKRFTEIQELNTLMATSCADSAADMADTRYIQMDEAETGHMTHSHAAASASLHRRLDVHGQSKEDPGYDELINCNTGGSIDRNGYSQLNHHNTSD